MYVIVVHLGDMAHIQAFILFMKPWLCNVRKSCVLRKLNLESTYFIL
jgi:hypothetical protein